MNGLKQTILLLCRAFGLFALTRYAYRGRLLILCYHGFSLRTKAHFVRNCSCAVIHSLGGSTSCAVVRR